MKRLQLCCLGCSGQKKSRRIFSNFIRRFLSGDTARNTVKSQWGRKHGGVGWHIEFWLIDVLWSLVTIWKLRQHLVMAKLSENYIFLWFSVIQKRELTKLLMAKWSKEIIFVYFQTITRNTVLLNFMKKIFKEYKAWHRSAVKYAVTLG